MNKDKLKLGFNTAGTEETFERILGESAGRAAKQHDLFVYHEIGIAEGTTLMAVAHYLKTLQALMSGSKFPFNWTAIGVDLYRGPFFDPTRFLYSPNAQRFNIELFYNGDNMTLRMIGSPSISIHLLPDGKDVRYCEIPPSTIDFCVIDGCHGAPCVERDFLAIEKAIKPGGIVAFHDAMPEDQGGEPGTNGWQAHCGTGIAVLTALQKLSLLAVGDNFYTNQIAPPARNGWHLHAIAPGDKSRGGNGFAFFRKV